ncbi:DUF6283 family protein [Micromonospora sp. 4G55]|uniref:DUF6283 family protein n=1 Tax=Micromonospora sp. 4G55 TaxID=2806102 RepID=UPI001EE3E581|nr:DUF6283 family protein [Micromonospora sp. 4G55]
MLSFTAVHALSECLLTVVADAAGWDTTPTLLLLHTRRPDPTDPARRDMHAIAFPLHPDDQVTDPAELPALLRRLSDSLRDDPSNPYRTTLGTIVARIRRTDPDARLLAWATLHHDTLDGGVCRARRVDSVDTDGRVYQLTCPHGEDKPQLRVDDAPDPKDVPAVVPGLAALLAASRSLTADPLAEVKAPAGRQDAADDEPIFAPWGPDGASLRCRVCAAVDEICQDEMPSMAGYGEDSYVRCTRCGSVEATDPIFGWRAKPATWPSDSATGADTIANSEQAEHDGQAVMADGIGADRPRGAGSASDDAQEPSGRQADAADKGWAMSRGHADTRGPAKSPCGSCPYRRDVPSGVWDASEYAKLPDYDAPTALQPHGLFLCHQADGRVCAGWAGCHDGNELLALRLAALQGMDPDEITATRTYVSPVPLFSSGQEAAAHGMARIEDPPVQARRTIQRLAPKIAARGLDTTVQTLPVPLTPVDGDCLTWAPATATRLRDLGHPARVVQVAGWADHQVIAFVHWTVLVADPDGDPDGGSVIDVTARQFDPRLPARWVLSWPEFLVALARAAGADRVTAWPEPPA